MLRVDGPRFRLRRRRRLILWLALGLLALIAMLLGLLAPRAVRIEIWPGASAAPISCPYSGGGPPFRVEAFEADRMRSVYLRTQVLAATNRLFPNDDEFALPSLKTGLDRAETANAVMPPQLLHAISWIESMVNQVHIDVPYGQIGEALISPDCGYGIMQVTSTIINDGDLPSRYEALVGTHFAYNIAAGAQILAEKWNDDYFPVVGASDPNYVESWYFALWAYNGWAWINHPANPAYDRGRGVYDCDPDRSDWYEYPYQEKVLGCVINPPVVEGQQLWAPHPVAMPDIDSLAAPGGPLDPDEFWETVDQIGERMSFALPSGAAAAWLTIGDANPDRAALLGSPAPGGLPDDELELTSSQLQAQSVGLTISNEGTGLLAWRIADAPSWLDVSIQAGVALGEGYGFAAQPSRLALSAAAGGVPEGAHRNRLSIEFHYPDGTSEPHAIAISLDKQGAARYEAGRPQS